MSKRHVLVGVKRGAALARLEEVRNGEPIELCLPEGEATLIVEAADEETGERSRHTEPMHVEDIFIAAVGDSFASGEGSPESSQHIQYKLVPDSLPAGSPKSLISQIERLVAQYEDVIVRWADDGAPRTSRHIEKTCLLDPVSQTLRCDLGDSIPGFRIRSVAPVSSYPTSMLDIFTPFSDLPVWLHHQAAHRSSLAASSQAALHLELASAHSSVTYVNLAHTGTDSLAIASQIDALSVLAQGRTIDALIVSAGGNDVGFEPLIEALLRRDECLDRVTLGAAPTFGTIRQALSNGMWASLVAGETECSGVSGLAGRLGAIKEAVDRLEGASDVNQVLLLEYPSLGHVTDSTFCDKVLATFQWGPCSLEIDSRELQFSDDEAVSPLNAIRHELANDWGWTWVAGIRSDANHHGLCLGERHVSGSYAPDIDGLLTFDGDEPGRWFRRAREAQAIQAPTSEIADVKGTAHPNEFGHQAAARRILENIVAEP